jgi:uncharacterized protein YbaR (Trm112 family)
MHLALTDRMVCPRCGPEFGLILLAHEIRDRRVLEGDLGCSNCRERYPVRGGFADLRLSSLRSRLSSSDGPGPTSAEPDETLRLGALLGVTEGPGTLLINGPAAWHAGSLSDLIGEVEIVALHYPLSEQEEVKGVSRMAGQPRLPFRSDTFRGVILSGGITGGGVEEAVRVVAPGGRLVLLGAASETFPEASALELKVIMDEPGTMVFQKEGPGFLPLVTLRGL